MHSSEKIIDPIAGCYVVAIPRSKSRRREEWEEEGEAVRSPVKSATLSTMSPLSPGQEETYTSRQILRSSQETVGCHPVSLSHQN